MIFNLGKDCIVGFGGDWIFFFEECVKVFGFRDVVFKCIVDEVVEVCLIVGVIFDGDSCGFEWYW